MVRHWVAAILLALSVSSGVAAAETCSAMDSWEAPAEGAVQMFRKGERAFGVGEQSGGALGGRVIEKRFPAPGCTPISNSKCSQNVETCSGSCTAYLNYYCKTCDCSKFKFCG